MPYYFLETYTREGGETIPFIEDSDESAMKEADSVLAWLAFQGCFSMISSVAKTERATLYEATGKGFSIAGLNYRAIAHYSIQLIEDKEYRFDRSVV